MFCVMSLELLRGNFNLIKNAGQTGLTFFRAPELWYTIVYHESAFYSFTFSEAFEGQEPFDCQILTIYWRLVVCEQLYWAERS